jgi:adenylate cyclase
MFGVELLAQATQSVLRGAPRHSHESSRVLWKIGLVTLLLSAVVAALALRGALWGIASGALAMCAACWIAVVSAREPQSWLGLHYWPPSAFLLAVPLACGMGVAYRQVKQARELKLVRDAFGAYVGEEVLKQMGDRMPELGGETRDIAVLFCDIRGYSALSERLRDDPAKLMSTLNAHFEPLVQALKDHGAYADNYVGDLVMALFGAPVSKGHLTADTSSAVLAALDFVRIVAERSRRQLAAGEEPIEIGIGVHCGPAVVGNLGTERKIHYTAIGDVVNIASRVESATRNYNVPLLVTEEVVRACQGHEKMANLSWEFVDETLVKGRQAPVRLYCSREAS